MHAKGKHRADLAEVRSQDLIESAILLPRYLQLVCTAETISSAHLHVMPW